VARVLSVHRQACNLVTPGGAVISLVTPAVGDGPFNIVLRDGEDLLAGIAPHAEVTLEPGRLVLDGLEVCLAGALVWEPRPDWDVLRARYTPAVLAGTLSSLQALNAPHVSHSTFFPLVGGGQATASGFGAARWRQAWPAIVDLRAGWKGELARLHAGACGLAGLGNGLTPAGDDLLVGLMLRAWLAHPDPEPLCREIATAAAPRTTTLSAAYLRAAAQGQCSASWHALLDALLQRQEGRIVQAMRKVLAHGATSGADSLIGFLCIDGTLGKGGALGCPIPD
jgi:hypothetical protein